MRRLDLLLTPGFLAALLLLVLNDHLFKTLWPGLLTGKLSDFAGLYAAIVFAAAWRAHHAAAIAWVTALAFTCWKSPLADLLIVWWNDLDVWPVARVVDYTDLVAIAIVPLAVRVVRTASARPPVVSAARLVAQCALAFVAASAFAATSRLYNVKLESAPRYLLSSSCEDLGSRLAFYALPYAIPEPGTNLGTVGAVSIEGVQMTFLVELRSSGEDKCLLTLQELRGHNDPRIEDQKIQSKAVTAFEEQVLDALDAPYEKQTP